MLQGRTWFTAPELYNHLFDYEQYVILTSKNYFSEFRDSTCYNPNLSYQKYVEKCGTNDTVDTGLNWTTWLVGVT